MVAASIPGRSEIRNATPIRRAHPHFVENLRSLGARVQWTAEEVSPALIAPAFAALQHKSELWFILTSKG